jgi:hypothetical protein
MELGEGQEYGTAMIQWRNRHGRARTRSNPDLLTLQRCADIAQGLFISSITLSVIREIVSPDTEAP